MKQQTQGIAFMMGKPTKEIVNIFSNTEEWKKAEVFSVGDVFDYISHDAAHKNARDKALRKSQRMYGKGPRHKQHMEYIFVTSVREIIRRFPFMRQKLFQYDPEYVEYRNRVDANKKLRASKKKVGVRFGG